MHAQRGGGGALVELTNEPGFEDRRPLGGQTPLEFLDQLSQLESRLVRVGVAAGEPGQDLGLDELLLAVLVEESPRLIACHGHKPCPERAVAEAPPNLLIGEELEKDLMDHRLPVGTLKELSDCLLDRGEVGPVAGFEGRALSCMKRR